jgi:hypothetical protein
LDTFDHHHRRNNICDASLRLAAASCLCIALTLARLDVALQITVLVSSGAGAVAVAIAGRSHVVTARYSLDQVVDALVVPKSGPTRGTNAKELCRVVRVWYGLVHGPLSTLHRATRPVHLCTCAPVHLRTCRKPQGTSAVRIALIRYTAALLHSACAIPTRRSTRLGRAMPMHGMWDVGCGMR